MKRLFFLCLVLALATGSVCADESLRAVQTRLKADGFYFGEINGAFDNDTAAAITRYQIRNGLQITGKLDARTRSALGVPAATSPEVPTPKVGEDVWRYLRKSDREYIKRVMAKETPTRTPASKSETQTSEPKAPTLNYDRERLRDYIAAFVLAGLDPQVGSEAEFFAEEVNYFGEPRVTREKIRRDLQRYDNHWPERRFWLAGELEVTATNELLKVTFPLRYELRSGPKRSSGRVWKTLILRKTVGDDLEIVSVNESKSR